MNKKLITVILALVLTLTIGLAACGGGTTSESGGNGTNSESDSGSNNGGSDTTPTTPDPDHLPFSEAAAAFGAEDCKYISFDIEGEEYKTVFGMDSFEYFFRQENPLFMSRYTYGEDSRFFFYADGGGTTYEIDTTRQIMALSEENISDPMQYFLSAISGEGTASSIEINNITYTSIMYEFGTGVVHLLNESNKLNRIYINLPDEHGAEVIGYLNNIKIYKELPASSVFNKVLDYRKTNDIVYRAATDDMTPAIEQGKAYYYEDITEKTLAVGDIIIYEKGNSYAIGRISAINTNDYTVKTDKAPTTTETVGKNYVRGVYKEAK